jgi:predicted component of viral defense system (DUF524 family)
VGAGADADLCVLDAKYRVDVISSFETTDPSGEQIKRAERRGLGKHDDLKAMHAYRDALTTIDGRRPRWVVALFPGTETRLYREAGGGKFDRDVEALSDARGGIGAIPVAPGEDGVLARAVEVILRGPGR